MRPLLLAVLLGLALGCWDDDDPIAAADRGRELFGDADFSDDAINVFSCDTCHSTRPMVADDARVIAYSVHDSAFRSSWWGGYAPRFIDAVSFCNVYFMGGSALDEEDEQGRALFEYLVRISPMRPADPLPVTIVENIVTLPRGNPALGEEVYGDVCARCHGAAHSGEGRMADWIPILPEATADSAHHHGVSSDLVIIEKVRHGRFFGIGGYMPFFSLERLSDDELGALLAFFEI